MIIGMSFIYLFKKGEAFQQTEMTTEKQFWFIKALEWQKAMTWDIRAAAPALSEQKNKH